MRRGAVKNARLCVDRRMKILIDMNLSPRWQKFLTEAGLQAAHWSELGAIKNHAWPYHCWLLGTRE
jgi:hypothetical protein